MPYEYIVTLPSVAESNETLIAKKTIRVLDCSLSIPETNVCNLWKYDKCPSDKDYCNPYVPGDIIYMQMFSPEAYYTNVFAQAIDSASGDVITPSPITQSVGTDKNGRVYLNLQIDTTDLDSKCFYIRTSAYKCKLDREETEELAICVADLVEQGYSQAEAKDICLASYCDENEIFYSEPFCLELCRKTILLEGTYPGYDCNGGYYGPFVSGTNSHKLQIRVYGEVNPTQFDIEQVKFSKRRTSAKLLRTFNLMLKGLPFYAAEKIAIIFASEEMNIDGEIYSEALNITKNNDEGQMWYINTTLLQECGPIDFTCD